MELRQLLRVLRRRSKFVLAFFLLGIVGAGAVSSVTTPTYSSQSRVYVTATAANNVDAYQLGLYSSTRIASYADLARDPGVLQKIIIRAGSRISTDQLASRLKTEAIPNTVILQVTVTAPDPQQAQDLAEAASAEIVELVATLETPKLDSIKADPDLSPTPPIVARKAAEASLNPSPVSPNITLNLVVGALLGLLVGMAGAVVRDMLDTSIKSREELGEATGSAVMSVIPFDSSVPKNPLISANLSRTERAEAFRVFRTNLQFIDIDSERHVLAISSALPNEGKTVTSTNLAISLAESGKRILLMDCDLRKPRVAKLLGLENSVGLISVLVGRAAVADCIQQYKNGLDVLATGPLPPNPAEVLGTRVMTELLEMLGEVYDVIIIDAPPLLPVADPAIIASHVDGVILVVRHGKTSRDHVEQAVGRLNLVGARVVGSVLNMTPKRSMGGYGYGYGYTDEIPTKVRPGARRSNASATFEPVGDSMEQRT